MIRSWCLVAAAVCAVAGCTAEKSTGGRPSARVGDCYVSVSAPPVTCAERHVAETVYVGKSAPPKKDEASAMIPCRKAQADFLGQDFNTRLDLQLWVARDRSWYRCDVLLRNSTRGSTGYQVLTGSLKGVLRKGVAIDLQACLGSPYDPATDQPYVSCERPHVAQELFVAPAIGTLEEKFPADVAKRATSACNATTSAAGILVGGRKVTAFYPKGSAAWASGERTADCWVTATSGTLPGARPLPAGPR